MAKIIELILTYELRGKGSDEKPYRRCVQLFTKSGALVAEYDPCGTTITDLDNMKNPDEYSGKSFFDPENIKI